MIHTNVKFNKIFLAHHFVRIYLQIKLEKRQILYNQLYIVIVGYSLHLVSGLFDDGTQKLSCVNRVDLTFDGDTSKVKLGFYTLLTD